MDLAPSLMFGLIMVAASMKVEAASFLGNVPRTSLIEEAHWAERDATTGMLHVRKCL